MRIQGGKVLDAVTRELGAHAADHRRFGELYQALADRRRRRRGQCAVEILTQKFYEVQKYLTVSHHGRLTYALITNKAFWDSLPRGCARRRLDRAVKESTEFFNETAAKDNAEALDKIKATGKMEFHVLTPEEKKAWIAKLMPVHKEMESRFGKEFIAKIYQASGFVPPQT